MSYNCGHERTPENTVGHVKRVCRTCRNITRGVQREMARGEAITTQGGQLSERVRMTQTCAMLRDAVLDALVARIAA